MKHPSLDQAKKMQIERGWTSYTGPKLEGPRAHLKPGDKAFPSVLSEIPDPPSELYCIGNVDALQEGLAVIGARKATPYGKRYTEQFARIAAERGIVIISGGAYGCDSLAHRAALSVGGRTVVFLGGGCDEVYPAQHYSLFQEVIDKGGVVVSELPWTYPALPFTFLHRNRLIAGLAKATLIVEAGLPSGTFSTADAALSANKDVLVVPGAISSKTSAGSNRLLYQGATPVVDEETYNDILFQIFGTLKQELPERKKEKGRASLLLRALEAEPLRTQEILKMPDFAKLKHSELLLQLAKLEKEKKICRYPDGRYGPC